MHRNKRVSVPLSEARVSAGTEACADGEERKASSARSAAGQSGDGDEPSEMVWVQEP